MAFPETFEDHDLVPPTNDSSENLAQLLTLDDTSEDLDLFLSEDDAYNAIYCQQSLLGFVTMKSNTYGRSKYGFNTHITVRCQNSGKYKERRKKEGKQQRRTSTRKTGCLFEAKIRWIGAVQRYQYNIVSAEHNHDPISELLSSSRHRRHTQEQFGLERLLSLVRGRSQASCATARDIASGLVAEYPGLKIIDEDIYRIRHQLRQEKYGLCTSTQDLSSC